MDKESVLVQDTGFSLSEWRRRSQLGELCGILGCFNETVTQCAHCKNHYCAKHKWVISTLAHGQ